MDRLLLSPEEAAEVLSIGRTRLYHLLATGALRSVQIGRSRRIPAAGLTEFVARLEQRAAKDVTPPRDHGHDFPLVSAAPQPGDTSLDEDRENR